LAGAGAFYYLHQMKNLRPVFASLFLLISSLAIAQYDPSKIDRKAVESYDRAMARVQDENYGAAIEALKDAIRRDNNYIEAHLSLAGIYGQLKNHEQSVSYYEKAFLIDSNYIEPYFKLAYAINLAGLGQFEKALSAVNSVLAKPDLDSRTRKSAEYRQKSFQFAVHFAEKHKDDGYVFAPVNLGDGVNSAESEYFPSISIEGNKLIFTRLLNSRNEDFFGSIRIGDKWQKAQQLKGFINTPENEGAQNVSQDGKWLVFTACHRPDGFGSCDLYISYETENGWSQPFNLGSKINTDQWESQPSLSPDKRDLYFASRRFGGYGGSDIYVSHLLANGTWSEPENLGPTVNTAADETEPFIHADNQTLYFVSNGLLGYGEADIFLIRKTGIGKWSEPENLGYPINTINTDGTMVIASDGVTTYFSSNRSDSKGGQDLYSFEMRPGMRPFKTLWIKGQVFDEKTKKGLPSSVELIDLATKEPLSKVQTDETGNYLITLPVGKDYAFNVNRKGYLFYSENYSLKDKSPDSTYEKNIPLQPIEVDAAIVLRNIFFDFSKFDLKEASQVELDKLVQLLKDNPTVKIQIEGHTDNIGSANDNLKLSENRAKAVVNYLVSKGIAASRLSSKGFGASKPVADNNSEEGRAQNRRTELKVVAK
jgi:outer membrane protein OmpA-like peptidoglycan-associated protein/tetratricopeptide (TPR) repeat protein